MVAAALTVPSALAELAGPPMPPYSEQALEAFWTLNETRTLTQFGPVAIRFDEMRAYQQMTGVRLTPLEVALVQAADRAFLSEMRERSARRQSPRASVVVPPAAE